MHLQKIERVWPASASRAGTDEAPHVLLPLPRCHRWNVRAPLNWVTIQHMAAISVSTKFTRPAGAIWLSKPAQMKRVVTMVTR